MGKLPFAPWTLSRSRVAIDAGPFRIRTEAARSTEDPQRRQIAQAIRALPELVDALAVLVLSPELDLRGRDPQGYEQAREASSRPACSSRERAALPSGAGPCWAD